MRPALSGEHFGFSRRRVGYLPGFLARSNGRTTRAAAETPRALRCQTFDDVQMPVVGCEPEWHDVPRRRLGLGLGAVIHERAADVRAAVLRGVMQWRHPVRIRGAHAPAGARVPSAGAPRFRNKC